MNTHRHARILAFLPFLLLAALLSGCSSGFSTPEDAAIDVLFKQGSQGISIDQASITAIDQGTIGNYHPVVMVFNATRLGKGPERCLYVYQVEGQFLGSWKSTGGWGMCRDVSDPTAPPVAISGGFPPGEKPTDPGLSTNSGLVLDERITSVQIKWKDGMLTNNPVASGFYFSAREGRSEMESLRAYDNSGQIVYEQ
jgi:hypothetical protein